MSEDPATGKHKLSNLQFKVAHLSKHPFMLLIYSFEKYSLPI